MSERTGSDRRASLLFLGDPKYDRRIQSFAHVLQSAGFAVSIYYTIPGSRATPIRNGDVQYIPLDSTRSSGPRLFLDHHLALRKHVSEISRSEIVMACDLYSLRAASLAKRRSLKSVLIYDARELYTGLPAVANKPFVRYVWKRWEKDGMLDTDFIAITAPHDGNAIFQVHRFLPRPMLIRNIPLRSQHTSIPSIPSEGRRAVYVGGLQQDRGLTQSILAMKLVPDDVKLLLMGSGSLENELKALAQREGLSERVIFAGAIDQEKVLPMLASCDVGISIIEGNSPSYALALPSKIFEYLHAGLPVVSTELQHVVELFDHQPYMEYVKEPTPERIAEAIENSLTKKQHLKDVIVEAAHQFSFENDFEKLRLLIEERLAERR